MTALIQKKDVRDNYPNHYDFCVEVLFTIKELMVKAVVTSNDYDTYGSEVNVEIQDVSTLAGEQVDENTAFDVFQKNSYIDYKAEPYCCKTLADALRVLDKKMSEEEADAWVKRGMRCEIANKAAGLAGVIRDEGIVYHPDNQSTYEKAPHITQWDGVKEKARVAETEPEVINAYIEYVDEDIE